MSRAKKDKIEIKETHSRVVQITRDKQGTIATLTKNAKSPGIDVRIGSDNYTGRHGASINMPVGLDPDLLREAIDKVTKEIPHE